MKQNRLIILLLVLFSVLMSIPFLVPGMGAVALVAFVPLLCAERIASFNGQRRFFWWYYAAFVLFNAFTTWWVCKATVGGGIFAVMANALFMSIIFAVFRISKKRFSGAVPYLFLATLWIAWERFYLTLSQISWPWLVLGNAFGRTTTLVQWYEYTGLLGGSLWVWASNLAIFGILVGLSTGFFSSWNKRSVSAIIGVSAVVLCPVIFSELIYRNYDEKSEGRLDVAIAQSNFNPYEKLQSVPQSRQNRQVIELFQKGLEGRGVQAYPSRTVLLMLPETFCSDIWKDSPQTSPTWRALKSEVVDKYPNVNLLFGASTHKAFYTSSSPDVLARRFSGGGGWYLSYNTAYITDWTGRIAYTDKSKLVVGSELTPYPKIFAPLDDALGSLMGRDVPQGEARNLDVVEYDAQGKISRTIPIGVPICYESIYSEFCTGYVRKGAQAICVITNDGWWGNTAGYRQHFSYSRLRAIELRRDIARCANTGISGIIDQKGDVLIQSKWWTPDLLQGSVNLNSEKTFFVRYGDIAGRICTFMAILLLLTLIVKLITKK